mmetsp:Transcript_10136/g.28767  ORF Transcript_10136/g.28767 Transcript_10136/m.28767 type:complete len:303 (-) Transcript_10136:76-984(-)
MISCAWAIPRPSNLVLISEGTRIGAVLGEPTPYDGSHRVPRPRRHLPRGVRPAAPSHGVCDASRRPDSATVLLRQSPPPLRMLRPHRVEDGQLLPVALLLRRAAPAGATIQPKSVSKLREVIETVHSEQPATNQVDVVLGEEALPWLALKSLLASAVQVGVANDAEEASHHVWPTIDTVLVPEIQEEAGVGDADNLAPRQREALGEGVHVVVHSACPGATAAENYLLRVADPRLRFEVGVDAVEDVRPPEMKPVDDPAACEACTVAIRHVHKRPIVEHRIFLRVRAEVACEPGVLQGWPSHR